MIEYNTFELIAGAIIIPTLIIGAYYDHKTRIFPKRLWNVSGKVAGAFTLLMYGFLLLTGAYSSVIVYILLSVITTVLFYILAMRFGSGGDFRTLMYIAWITPTLLVLTLFGSLVLGFLQVVAATIFKKGNFFSIRIPWTIGIAIAYILVYSYTLSLAFGIGGII